MEAVTGRVGSESYILGVAVDGVRCRLHKACGVVVAQIATAARVVSMRPLRLDSTHRHLSRQSSLGAA